VRYKGEQVNVMSLVGASPDAVICDSAGDVKTVIEIKCCCPFNLNGAPPLTRRHASQDTRTQTRCVEPATTCQHACQCLFILLALTWVPVSSGEKWMYLPGSKPLSHIDPAYVVQMQFQIRATGAATAYLISWATGISVFTTAYSAVFIAAAADVLKHVVELYVEQDLAIPNHALQFPPPLRAAWLHMHGELRALVKACHRSAPAAG
jgi:hypothetical protein